MNYEAACALLEKYGQEHVLRYYEKLSDVQKEKLLNDIDETDFSALRGLEVGKASKPLGEITPADALTLKDIKKRRSAFLKAGEYAIGTGKVAAVLLAGGQGTRLGYNGPKGTFNIGVNKQLSIFECQINNLKAMCGNLALVHLFIMTSSINDAATRAFFEENAYFGYDKEKVHFFVQGEAPVVSFDGKILMEEKYKIAVAPDGNGGWYNALIKAGYGKLIKKWGIEWFNIGGVDNVLQRLCDPLFVGATLESGLPCGAKVVKKVSPEEKVGVLCKENGIATVIEYYDMPTQLKNRHDVKGELVYSEGVILNYMFSAEKLAAIAKKRMPYHLAAKKIPCIKGGRKFTPEEPNGYKLEMLAVDIVKMMGSCLGFEVEREKEFAPVKNAEGVDSVETARALLIKNKVSI